MRKVRGLTRLALIAPALGFVLVPSLPVFAASGDTAGLSAADTLAGEMSTWNATQADHYQAKVQALAIVSQWAATSTTGAGSCANDNCPPPEVTVQEDGALQSTDYYCGPASSHNVLYTFYNNAGAAGSTPSQDQVAGQEGTNGDGTDRGAIPPALNRYQSTNTYALGTLSNGDDVWNYAVTDLWRGYGSIWNIESYDHFTGQFTLPWYPNVDILHYFASYAYKTSNHDVYVFDENNQISNHWFAVDPTTLYNASLANNRQSNGSGPTPQVIW